MSNFKIGNSKFARFVNGKGFYIALAVCLVAIGAAAYIAVNNSIGIQNNIASQNSGSDSQQTSSIPNWDAKQTGTNVSGVSSSSSESSSKVSSSSEASQSSSSAPAKIVYMMPFAGKVVNQFSGDTLVSDVTMGDWRTHNGVDLGAAQGTPVKACANGKVTDVRVDAMLGQVVEIDHGSGIKTLYANLTNQVTVKKGQTVEVGNVIGTIGDTAQGEVALTPHLHFEMTVNGKQVDPLAKIGG